jgi:hypothetical protein
MEGASFSADAPQVTRSSPSPSVNWVGALAYTHRESARCKRKTRSVDSQRVYPCAVSTASTENSREQANPSESGPWPVQSTEARRISARLATRL